MTSVLWICTCQCKMGQRRFERSARKSRKQVNPAFQLWVCSLVVRMRGNCSCRVVQIPTCKSQCSQTRYLISLDGGYLLPSCYRLHTLYRLHFQLSLPNLQLSPPPL